MPAARPSARRWLRPLRPGMQHPAVEHRPDRVHRVVELHVGLTVDGRRAVRRPHEPEQHPQRRRLARAVRSQEPDHAALVGREREVVDGQHRAEALGQAGDLDRVRHRARYLAAAPVGIRSSADNDPREGHMKGVRTGVGIALVGILAGGGGAYAATQITSAEIKDGTIQAKDIKKGTITASNLAAAARTGDDRARRGRQVPPDPPARRGADRACGRCRRHRPCRLRRRDGRRRARRTEGRHGAKGDPGSRAARAIPVERGAAGIAGPPARGRRGRDRHGRGERPAERRHEETDREAVATCPDGQQIQSRAASCTDVQLGR